uniref:Lipoyl-binding domain-containing protein n=1 Tax=Panagrolaimus davidi TaxID=227884 RepID=A0A914RBC8_9BILA
MSAAIFPTEFNNFEQFRQKYGPVSHLSTRPFLTGLDVADETFVEIEDGKTLVIRFLATGKLNEKGEREMFFELNGQTRSIFVQDNEASKNLAIRPRAKPSEKGSIGSPMPGEILEISVKEGDKINANQTLFVLSAMKMEMVVASPISGKIRKIYASKKDKVEGGDLIIEIESD